MTTEVQPTQLDASPKGRRVLPRWGVPAAIGVVSLVVGAGAGFAVGAVSDNSDLERLEERLSMANDRAREANNRADVLETRAAEAAERASELEQREAAVATREQAVAVVEQQVAANSIEEGIWTVGVDVEPGTYRVSEPLTDYCWAIFRTGTSGSDIVDNDGPTGGFPTVTLSPGQDFQNRGCGTFVKQ